ncbi:hypothetical protein TSAR_012809 [Trichomalopsis sarcophagae]|uniref:Uncharacterized protein n=1 Tax=Trichomalopsis sarcophagae TaxID=543379 RepID=A0A232EFQ9_9HYME|nr:hypothetical protein TSAR_012809 [Trichomalopsis sarcophagae]
MYESMYKYAVLTNFMLCKCKYCLKSVIDVLKVTYDERLVKLFKNWLPCQFLLNHPGSAFHLQPYDFGIKKYSIPIQIKLQNFNALSMIVFKREPK